MEEIKKVKLSDGIERYYLDSEEKIKKFVKIKYDENHDEIDLSNVIIIMNNGKNHFTPNLLCDALPDVCKLENDKFTIKKKLILITV